MEFVDVWIHNIEYIFNESKTAEQRKIQASKMLNHMRCLIPANIGDSCCDQISRLVEAYQKELSEMALDELIKSNYPRKFGQKPGLGPQSSTM